VTNPKAGQTRFIHDQQAGGALLYNIVRWAHPLPYYLQWV